MLESICSADELHMPRECPPLGYLHFIALGFAQDIYVLFLKLRKKINHLRLRQKKCYAGEYFLYYLL